MHLLFNGLLIFWRCCKYSLSATMFFYSRVSRDSFYTISKMNFFHQRQNTKCERNSRNGLAKVHFVILLFRKFFFFFNDKHSGLLSAIFSLFSAIYLNCFSAILGLFFSYFFRFFDTFTSLFFSYFSAFFPASFLLVFSLFFVDLSYNYQF